MTGPWAGTRVVDLSNGLAGAYGTRLWAALGAEVIVVEPPGGSPIRQMAPFVPADRLANGADESEASLWWAYYAAGKQSVVASTEAPFAGDEAVAELLATADVVIDGAKPADLDRPGTGRSAILARNPSCTWVAVTPFGLTGPHREWLGSDLIGWAACGLAATVGFPDRPPLAPAGELQVLLHVTSMHAVIGAMLARRATRASGAPGQLVDISIQETGLSLAPETGVPLFLDDQVPRPRGGNRRPVTSPMGLYPCADGHVAIIAIQPNHWNAVAQWIHEVSGNEGVLEEIFLDMTVRAEALEAIDEWVEDLTGRFTKLELFLEGQKRGIPITPVNTVADLRSDPHLEATGWWREEDHPALGSYTVPGSPFTTSDDWWVWSRAPRLGEHDPSVGTSAS